MANQLNAVQSLRKVKEVFNSLKAAQNPQVMLDQMMNGNPQYKSIMDAVKSSGDARSLFYKVAEQKGVDPEEILGMLR